MGKQWTLSSPYDEGFLGFQNLILIFNFHHRKWSQNPITATAPKKIRIKDLKKPTSAKLLQKRQQQRKIRLLHCVYCTIMTIYCKVLIFYRLRIFQKGFSTMTHIIAYTFCDSSTHNKHVNAPLRKPCGTYQLWVLLGKIASDDPSRILRKTVQIQSTDLYYYLFISKCNIFVA